MEYDLAHSITEEPALHIAAITANTTTVGLTQDSMGYESLTYLVHAGSITDGTYDIILEESDDPGMVGATLVPADNTLLELPRFTSVQQNSARHVGSIGKMRYQRISIVSIAVTTGGTFGIMAVRGHKKSRPPAETVNV